MGLPGSGKTSLAKRLYPYLKAVFLNNDEVRKEANDWDFSPKGRERQTKKNERFGSKHLNEGKNVIADFVCPTEKTRKDFNADILIWVDTIKKGRFKDTNSKCLKEPKNFITE